MKDLAPKIYRQRLIVEGTCAKIISSRQIKNYLIGLSKALDMRTLNEPMTHRSLKFGWAGWIHWEASGCHFYAWDKPRPFFSADIYTCKAFNASDAVAYTKKFFQAKEIVFKEV